MKVASEGTEGGGKGWRSLRQTRQVKRGSQECDSPDGTRRGDLPWWPPITHSLWLGCGFDPCAVDHCGDTVSVLHSVVFM